MGEHGGIRSDLRHHASRLLLEHATGIAEDAGTAVLRSGTEEPDDDFARRVALQLVHLLAYAVGDGGLDGRGGLIGQLSAAAAERSMPAPALFSMAFAAERSALEELALDETIGAMSESWASVAELVRAASFDLLAAFVQRTHAASSTIVDPVTATRTRAYFDAALATECDRAGRFGDRLALIVIKVDDMPAIGARLGSGVHDKILQRLGILVRQYFRRQDLVARHAADAIAVLLVRADAEHAEDLADRVRATIAHRLESADHRSGESVVITASAAVVHAGGAVGAIVDPERLLVDAERALQRAADHGGNRVEAIQSASAIRTPPRNSPSA